MARTTHFTRIVRPGETVTFSVEGSARWRMYRIPLNGVHPMDPPVAFWDDTFVPGLISGSPSGVEENEDGLVMSSSYLTGIQQDVRLNPDCPLKVFWYDDTGQAFRVGAVKFGEGDQRVWLAKDRALLAILERAREEAADTQGIVKVTLPDGHAEEFASHAALIAVVDGLRARVVRRELRLGGQFLQGWVAR